MGKKILFQICILILIIASISTYIMGFTASTGNYIYTIDISNGGIITNSTSYGHTITSSILGEKTNTTNYIFEMGFLYSLPKAYTIANKSNEIKLVLEQNTGVDITATLQSGYVNVLLGGNSSTGNFSAIFAINFNSSIDFSPIKTGVNFSSGKAFVHNTSLVPQVVNVTLLVPIQSTSSEVYICPGALSFEQINGSCPNKTTLQIGMTINGMTVTNASYDGQQYYKIAGITGTGGGEGNAPNLTSPSVSPTTGDINTLFYFTVNYSDIENDNASFVFVNIDNVNYTMTQYDISDTNFADGKIYNYSTTLSLGSHWYYFIAADMANVTVNTSNFTDITVVDDIIPPVVILDATAANWIKSGNVTQDLRATDTNDWSSTFQRNSLAYDSTRNVIYLVGSSGVFGFYNASTNVTYALNETDPGNWIGSTIFWTVTYDPTRDVVYLGGNAGFFGVYNASTNVTSNLSATDTGNWLTLAILSLAYDSKRNVIYVGGTNVFGVYNASTNVTADLRATDTGNWMGTSNVNSLLYEPTRDVLYIGAAGGRFGVYNASTNVSSNLNETDTNDWIGTKDIEYLAYDSKRDVVYLVGSGGVFGVYNASTNVTSALNATDTDNWIGSSNSIKSVVYDSKRDVVYLSGLNGVFGEYNASSNVTSDLRATDTGNWIASVTLWDLIYEPTRDVVYIGGNSGVFGFYNASIQTGLPNTWGANATNGTWFNYRNVTLKYSAIDSSGISSCILYGNFNSTWSANYSNSSLSSDTLAEFRLNLTTDAKYLWNVWCNDTLGNSAFNSTNFTFYADTTIPSIQITSPIDNFNTTSSTILFNWTALDNLDIELLCNLTIDTVVNRTYLSSANGSAVNVSVAGFNASAHTIKVSCIDNATNSNISATNNFYYLSEPDSLLITLMPDNRTVSLNWSNVTIADYFNIYITDNWANGFASVPNVSGIAYINWTDSSSNISQTRYYKIQTKRGNVNYTSNKTVAKFVYSLDSAFNLVSLPVNISIWQLNNGSNNGIDLHGLPEECVETIYRYNTTAGKWDALVYEPADNIWLPAVGSENFTMLEPARGYFFENNYSCNISYVGSVPTASINVPLSTGYNLVGWYSQRTPTLGETATYGDPLSTTPSESILFSFRFNPTSDAYQLNQYFEGYGWWPPPQDAAFTTLEPGRAYWVESSQSTTWNHQP